MIHAIVLAAGESKRMGMPKPLLRFPRSTAVPAVGATGILPVETLPITRCPRTNAERAGLQDRPGGGPSKGSQGQDAPATHGRDAHATTSGDTTFLEQIVSVLRQSDVDGITVVLGAHAQQVRRSTDLSGTDITVNEDYQEGQLSSLFVGLGSMPSQAEAIVLCLVDNPLITCEIVNRIAGAFRETGKPIVVPVFRGRRGHPALFARPVFDELLHAPADQGARQVVQSNRDRVHEVEILEPAILARIDTPEDYRSHFGAEPQIIS